MFAKENKSLFAFQVLFSFNFWSDAIEGGEELICIVSGGKSWLWFDFFCK